MNQKLSLNLLKLKSAGVTKITGKTGAVKECLIIPIEDNQLYVSKTEEGKPKGVFLDLTLWENQTPSQYGDTHYCKQNFSKEYREAHAEEIKNTPILGNMKPIGGGNNATPSQDAALPFTSADNNQEASDLPF